jgi:antitoxin (DNA-binding transcriptional repressor) of toxin-antitoxin stability system
MGVPVTVQGKPYAVICPVASRIDRRLRQILASLLVIVADERERARISAVCAAGTRFQLIPVVALPDQDHPHDADNV